MALDGTLTGLKATIKDWLLRVGDTRFEARIPDLIVMGEATLNKTLRALEMQGQQTLVTVGGTDTVAAPTGFLQGVSLSALDYQAPPIDQMDGAALDTDFAGAASGRVRAYSAWAGLFTLGPTPDAAYNLRSRYFKKLTPLTDDAPTNPVLVAHPDLYLYAALMQAAPTLRDQDAAAMWQSALESGVGLANEMAQETLNTQGRARRIYGKGI